MKINRISPLNGSSHTKEIAITPEQYQKFEMGIPIREAAPGLNEDEYIFIDQGLIMPEYRKIYGKGCCG